MDIPQLKITEDMWNSERGGWKNSACFIQGGCKFLRQHGNCDR